MSLDGGDTADVAAQTVSPPPPETQHLLYIWLSPAFPVGAFAYSHGLEQAAERGLVTSRATLQAWLADLIEHGSLRNDLIVLAASYRATAARDPAALVAANSLALALQPSAERFLETTQQGGSFLLAIANAWPHPPVLGRGALGDVIAYPAAVGIAAAAHAVPLSATLTAFGFAFVTNLTSAAIRLSVMGQTGAQAIIAALTPQILAAATAALTASLEDIASATFSADLCSLEHETQYSRLFRS